MFDLARRFTVYSVACLSLVWGSSPPSAAAPGFTVSPPLPLPAGNTTGLFAHEFETSNDVLYFGGDADNKTKIYSWDGNVVTALIDNPTTGPGYGPFFAVVERNIYYAGLNAAFTESDLWRFDGATSTPADDLNPSGSTNPGPFFQSGNFALFRANTSPFDNSLFKVQNNVLTPIPMSGAYARDFVPYEGEIYYLADDNGLYRTDGTSATAISGNGPGQSMDLTTYNGQLYLAQYRVDAPQNSEIWKYDGARFQLIGQSATSCLGCHKGFVEYKDKLYVTLSNPFQLQLLRVDADALVPVTSFAGNVSVYDAKVAGDYLYFSVRDIGSGELYRFDGVNVLKLSNVNPLFATVDLDYTSFGDTLFFAADGPLGRELYSYDGNAVQLVADLEPGAGSSNPVLSSPQHTTTFRGEFYFNTYAATGVRTHRLSIVPEPSSAAMAWLALAASVGSLRRKTRDSSCRMNHAILSRSSGRDRLRSTATDSAV